jgi:hypothetical protein
MYELPLFLKFILVLPLVGASILLALFMLVQTYMAILDLFTTDYKQKND